MLWVVSFTLALIASAALMLLFPFFFHHQPASPIAGIAVGTIFGGLLIKTQWLKD